MPAVSLKNSVGEATKEALETLSSPLPVSRELSPLSPLSLSLYLCFSSPGMCPGRASQANLMSGECKASKEEEKEEIRGGENAEAAAKNSSHGFACWPPFDQVFIFHFPSFLLSHLSFLILFTWLGGFLLPSPTMHLSLPSSMLLAVYNHLPFLHLN
ncbi:hypothetical protein ACLOJK_012189 [Asimina triloba]